jgi:hypothetical protein
LGTAVSLKAGGELSIRWSGGGQAHIRFTGANARSEPHGEVSSGSKTIYYVGAADDWRTASRFERVRYSAIYPGIDLVFVITGSQLEYNFEIAPHADSGAIRIDYEESTLDLTPGGDLEMRAGNAAITQRRPLAYQSVAGQTRRVACHYRLKSGHEAYLRLGSYDRSQPLLIDPVLNFSTYFGGSSFDSINAATTDAQGNLYVTGETSSGSLTNPSAGPRSSRDVFIAKLNSAGAQVFVVYLGGSDYDSGRGIALDPLGNIYVTGVTSSSDFPVTNGALSTHASGREDAFVAKFNSSFALQYSTYLGGEHPDFGLAIAVDSTGAAYVAGQTESATFPITQGAFQSSNQGGISDCFISKLNPAGSALTYSTLLGGSALDLCAGIAVDALGNAYVAGTTYSTNFPVVGWLQSSLLGTANAFVTKLNATGSTLVYSTYLGGSGVDNATAIAMDSSGAAYVTGATASIDFPTTPGVVQNNLNGQYNAFVSKLSAAGNTLVYSTLIGGSGSDESASIAIDASGRAIIGGYTTSSNFPTLGAIQANFRGAFDAFSTVLDPAGASLVFSSYFGGSGDDRGYAVAAAPGNNLYLAGMTSSSNFPLAAAIQTGLSVSPDAFVLEVTYMGGVPTADSVSPNSGSGTSRTFALQYSDPGGAASLQLVYVYFNATLASSASNSCFLYYSVGSNQINLLNDAGTTWMAAIPGTATTLQNSQCSVNTVASSVALNGNTLTLNLAITFKPAFAGAKNIYLYGADVSGSNSGWQQRGTWTVPSGIVTVTANSVTPSSGSVATQTFALQYSDSAGAASLQTVYVYFNATLASPSNSCFLYYNIAANQINLLNDAGVAWMTATPGAGTTLQNSQCWLNVAATSVAQNGNTLTLNLAMTFKTAFAGAKYIYMYGADVSGPNSGWQQLGTWTVPSGIVAVTANSVTPSSGSLASQAFALQYSDTSGAASVQLVYAYFNTTLASSASNSCFLSYNIAANQISLLNDAGAAWMTATPGAGTTLQNSQCSLNVAATTVALNGITLTLNLAMTFKPAFAGAKNIYMYGADVSGPNSGWQQLGTWTVPSGVVTVTANSVTPYSGYVASQVFALQYSDTSGAASVQLVYAYFHATLASSANNSCFLYYNVAANQINLLNDAGAAWMTATPGSATTLQNSQCALNVTATTVALNGITLALNLAMTFKPVFAGAKNIYMYAADISGPNSGWQQLGTWTVP